MSSELYSNRVLELAGEVPHRGRLAQPQGTAHKVSRLCGSEVTVDVVLDGQTIAGFAIDPQACALGQAAASVLAGNIIGASAGEIVTARDQLAAMLRAGGPPPTGRFWELRYLEPVREYPSRQTSTLLAFEAAVAAIDMALQGVQSGPASDMAGS
jgi:NifU-like protein involved in Fe-S cluster formation